MNARVYDPTTARFMSADPVLQNPYNLQSHNRYSYVMNNPLAWHHHGIRTGRFNWGHHSRSRVCAGSH